MNAWVARYRGYLFLSLVFCVALGGLYFLSRRADPAPVRVSTPFPRPTATLHPTSTPTGIVIEVSGAVITPGLVHLADGARVDDAIRAAGGPSAAADLARLNLARKVSDGELLLVPAIGDSTPAPAGAVGAAPAVGTRVPRPTPTPTPALPVNINTASADELARLPGIGPALAQRIIDYRQANGPYQKIEDITKVKGIGPVEFGALKNRIVVQ